MEFDVLIKNGSVIDGTGKPRHLADIGIRRDRIEAIGTLSGAQAQRVINAEGKIVAPGFVDVHNHSDGWLLKRSHLTPKTTQGFTTEVLMADGISYAPVKPHNAQEWIYYLRSLNALHSGEYLGWESIDDYMQTINQRTAQNFIAHVPYANVRVNAVGWGRVVPDDYQMREICHAIRQGMDEGAVGLSTGLDYIAQCFSQTAELVEACTAMAEQQGLYVTHMRYKKGRLIALREAVKIARRAGVPLHVSHLKGSDPQETEQILHYIDSEARKEVDFSFDVYPYQPGSTMLNSLLPNEIWEEGPSKVAGKLLDPDMLTRFDVGLDAYRLDLDYLKFAWVHGKENSSIQGQAVSEYILESGLPQAQALANLLLEERLAVLCVFHEGDDERVWPFLQHDLYMMGSDGIYFEDAITHPRMFGSATRLLGRAVRDWKLFSLEDAVKKMTSIPSRRFGLKDRGELRTGAFADIVVFDAEEVIDNATYETPQAVSTGIEQVLVNGVPIITDSQPIMDLPHEWPGRALRFNQ